MSDPIWYFADGDTERGPVTKAQIKTLIGTGNLKRDDLVWTEGMEDWVPAGEVPGLFAEGTPPPPAETSEPKSKRQSDSKIKGQEKPQEKPKGQATKAQSAQGKSNGGEKTSAKTDSPIPREPKTPVDYSKPIDIFRPVAALGQPLLVVGFVLVLFSRGCDSVAMRLDVAKSNGTLTESATAGDASDSPSPAELESRPSGSKLWGVLRELSFWIATLVFSFGLLIVGFTSSGVERWFSLVVLAIIVFHFYIGHL